MGETPGQVRCGDRACPTGQIIGMDANKSRQVSSHFFGRNKKSTQAIDFDVWHRLCNASYQRARCAAQKQGPVALCHFYLEHLAHQFDRIRLWRPEATFTVQLWKAAKERLARYHTITSRGGSKEEAKQQVAAQPNVSKTGDKPKPLNEADAVSIDHAEYLDTQLAGTRKSIDYIVDTVLLWIRSEVDSGAMVRMPPVEFLINEPLEGDTIIDPLTNYARWEAYVNGREYVAPETELTEKRPEENSNLTITPSTARPPIKLDLSLARFRGHASNGEIYRAPWNLAKDDNQRLQDRIAVSSTEEVPAEVAFTPPAQRVSSLGSAPFMTGGEEVVLPSIETPGEHVSGAKQPRGQSPSLVDPLAQPANTRGKKRKRSLDSSPAGLYAPSLPREMSPLADAHDSDRVWVEVEAPPRIVRDMAYSGGGSKWKLVPRRITEDVYDNEETEGENEGEGEVEQ